MPACAQRRPLDMLLLLLLRDVDAISSRVRRPERLHAIWARRRGTSAGSSRARKPMGPRRPASALPASPWSQTPHAAAATGSAAPAAGAAAHAGTPPPRAAGGRAGG